MTNLKYVNVTLLLAVVGDVHLLIMLHCFATGWE